MPKQVTLSIDGRPVTVAEGTMIVDAAKTIGIDIPVFCYHPKMEPVGMCRMCLVEIGRPVVDRASGKAVLEADGSPKLQFSPKPETACTSPVSEGMVVNFRNSDKVVEGRKAILEFLLTSHPLDCPVCDKGGECPLQNLTLGHGPSESRFIFDDKQHLAKHVPLGELIWLDRERCIQCARCVRFQDEIAGEPVIGFFQRGRSLEIITSSEPGLDSVFSGNTTDICPVGALTTADFRFGARPWEMKAAASVCTQCPVGCNLTLNTRREAKSDGRVVVKRVMPRQNEAVNEIWICDKGRFAYHFAESADRLARPLVRKGGKLGPAKWGEALELAARKLGSARKDAVVLAGGRLANEDLFNLKQLADGLGGDALLYTSMGGGELTSMAGVGPEANFAGLGKGATILVAASDLYNEAPVWYLRLKQAAKRGATLIVAGGRETRLEKYAAHVVRYAYGDEAEIVAGLLKSKSAQAAAEALASAEALVVLYGSDGLGLEGSSALAAACAGLLVETGHAGKPNSGMVGVWPRANDQGAWELGFRPASNLARALKGKTVYVAAADPAGDDPDLAAALKEAKFVVAQELFLSATAQLADVVLPAQAFTERDGSLTSGERRVQRFYPAVPALPGTRPDFAITAALAKEIGLDLEGASAPRVMERIAAAVPAFTGLSYRKLSETAAQWPVVGRGDMYYGGTTYQNDQGLGVQLALTALTPHPSPGGKGAGGEGKAALRPKENQWLAVPVTRLFDRGVTVATSKLLQGRIGEAGVIVHPDAAKKLGLGETAEVRLNGVTTQVRVILDRSVPASVVLVPRSMGLPIDAPAAAGLKKA